MKLSKKLLYFISVDVVDYVIGRWNYGIKIKLNKRFVHYNQNTDIV